MGEVYLASDITAGRMAALKLLPPRFTSDPERVKRFQQEARAVVRLNHPNILTVYEIGEATSTYYIASELIEGETLRTRLRRGPMEIAEALDVAIQVASALAAAHEAGIIHRDIKPENIMLRRDGYVKVLDFGIAKLVEPEVPVPSAREEALSPAKTNLGSILGTVRYMSPEQACGAAVDQRTDNWSLGVVLYEMIAGHVPFTGETSEEIIASILQKEPPPLTTSSRRFPTELQQIISSALQKDHARRYCDARDLLEVLKSARRRMDFDAEAERAPRWWRWTRPPTVLAALAFVAALAVALSLFWDRGAARPAPGKSIAVLPFESLNDKSENTYFAAGVQDEILSDLAQIAELKVISRTSANFYKSRKARNSREIGEQLGVANLLEGSVQRFGNRLRIHAQLIDARSDMHLWAQTYDRDISDLFAIQREIAKAIADQLRAKISPAESAAIASAGTRDVIAAQLYARGLAEESQGNLLAAAGLFEQAVMQDPQFVRAYCQLSKAHLTIYFSGEDHTPARRDLALAALEKAERLQPEAGEVHLARARYYYHGFRQYDEARVELDVARRTLPNDPGLYFLLGAIDRRQGRFAEALRNFDRAVELDPRNREFLDTAATTYHSLHRYADEAPLARRIVEISPRDYGARAGFASQALDERGDVWPLHDELRKLQTEGPDTARDISGLWFECARLERDPVAMIQALLLIPREGIRLDTNFVFPREWFAARAAQASGDIAKSRDAFVAARAIAENIVRTQPEEAPGWSLLGRIDAALGHKQEAIAEGRRACELLPITKDAWAGPYYVKDLASIYAATGENDLALEQLALLRQKGVHYGELKLDPTWDALRPDPRFEKLVADLAPRNASSAIQR